MMRPYRIQVCLVVFALMLAACGAAAGPKATGPINPGDKIGDLLVTTGDTESVKSNWELSCPDEGSEPYSCTAKVGTKVNISWGTYASPTEDLETTWSEHTHEIFVNDRPVNLQAFGSVDVVHPHVGEMRYWNVVILARAPGEVAVRNRGVAGGDPFDSTMTLTFEGP